ncbi:MAG TPA: hypothetical protein VKQ52_19750, partial [Puia sp.]|nr:hypothetical protein [Puia sp.]
ALSVIVVVMMRIYSSNFEFGKLGFMRTAARAITYTYWYPIPKEARQIAGSACESDIYCLQTEKTRLLSSTE